MRRASAPMRVPSSLSRFGTIAVDAERVKCPVYGAGGAHDRIISQASLRFTAQRYGAELDVLPEHGHWLLEEPGWERLVESIAAWLERVLSPPASRELRAAT